MLQGKDEKGFMDGRLSINSPMRGDGIEYVIIEVECEKSGTRFLELRISHADMMKAIQRSGDQKCKIKCRGLHQVGKKMEHKQFEFPFDRRKIPFKELDEMASREAIRVCPEGWYPDLYFGSKNSFFTKDGTEWARTIIRRWV